MKKSYQQARRRAAEGITYKHDLGQHFLYDEALLSSLVVGLEKWLQARRSKT